MNLTPVIQIRCVTKCFSNASAGAAPALTEISLSIGSGQLVAVVGKSGSGKSTLLNLLAGLDRPTSGSVVIAGQSLANLSEDALALWRGRNVGVVFQFFQLMPTLSALENVLLAMDFVGRIPRGLRRSKGLQLLAQFGLADHAGKLPAALSGGEQQRVAIARALANDPVVIVADEPTGSLDSRMAEAVVNGFRSVVAEGRTLVLVTHDEELARRADRVIRLADGVVVEDTQGVAP
jgi:putative ABC transport system ATP-binding protein